MADIIVLGHKSPDTDAICSAIVWAHYLQSLGVDAQAIRLGEINNETRYVMEKAGVELPPLTTGLTMGQKIVLTDHNEAGQSIDNRSNYKIIGVVDHHKVADFETTEAVAMRIEPVGCACTVIYALFKEAGYTPDATKLAFTVLCLKYCIPMTAPSHPHAAVSSNKCFSGTLHFSLAAFRLSIHRTAKVMMFISKR